MKKSGFLFALMLLGATSLHAQLAQSKWKGTLQLDNPIDVVLDFSKDTLNVYSVADNSGLETMVFTAKEGVLTITKVYGASSCDSQNSGKYSFAINQDELLLTLVSDDCTDRSNVLNKSKWTRSK